ncbi:TPA: YdiU family protein [Clostridium perfringens]|nr:YdiU family protein [Clostridium perfringens]
MNNKNFQSKTGFNLENTYLTLPNIFFSEQNPKGSKNPKLIKFNTSLAEELGLNEEVLNSDFGLNIFAGNETFPGIVPITQAYAGHQFGHFTMLGDGRALLLGEHVTKDGKRYDVQLKGSGRTIYSRGGDGKAALAPMLREYIISEGMHGLGIPTTRSLAVVSTGEEVLRERFEQGAILTRIASSHIRVGTFAYAAQWGTLEDLKSLADYTIERHFPNIAKSENKYILFLEEVINRQAALIVKWQSVGFIHGVMNTDNMVISGETIDYGPCAFMDTYDTNTVFSSIDYAGRYAYGNQPNMALWNLARFSEALLPLLNPKLDEAVNIAKKSISNFSKLYKKYWFNKMRAKLGLFIEKENDELLIEGLLSTMQKYEADFTNTFVSLTLNKFEDEKVFSSDEFKTWYALWQNRLKEENRPNEEVRNLMMNNNPYIIPRNHLVEEALKNAEKGDFTFMDNLLEALKNPYSYSKDLEKYTKLPEKSDTPYVTYCGT